MANPFDIWRYPLQEMRPALCRLFDATCTASIATPSTPSMPEVWCCASNKRQYSPCYTILLVNTPPLARCRWSLRALQGVLHAAELIRANSAARSRCEMDSVCHDRETFEHGGRNMVASSPTGTL
eukprot:jgi/Ulvmu1/3517/UM162_0024.1